MKILLCNLAAENAWEKRYSFCVFSAAESHANILLCNLAVENVREQRYRHFSVKMTSWVKLAPPLSTTQKKAILQKSH